MPLELLLNGLFMPMKNIYVNGKMYILSTIDDYNRHTWVKVSKHKDY